MESKNKYYSRIQFFQHSQGTLFPVSVSSQHPGHQGMWIPRQEWTETEARLFMLVMVSALQSDIKSGIASRADRDYLMSLTLLRRQRTKQLVL